jgi:hypothetical protein
MQLHLWHADIASDLQLRSIAVIFVLIFAPFRRLLRFSESFYARLEIAIDSAAANVESRIVGSVAARQATRELRQVKGFNYAV